MKRIKTYSIFKESTQDMNVHYCPFCKAQTDQNLEEVSYEGDYHWVCCDCNQVTD